jgi:hypothetical protein
MDDETKEFFDFYWHDFRQRFWFMTSFLEDVEKGCTSAFEGILERLNGTVQVEHPMIILMD